MASTVPAVGCCTPVEVSPKQVWHACVHTGGSPWQLGQVGDWKPHSVAICRQPWSENTTPLGSTSLGTVVITSLSKMTCVSSRLSGMGKLSLESDVMICC